MTTRETQRTIPQAVADRKEFTNSTGSVTTERDPIWVSAGRLNDSERHRLEHDREIGLTYVVFSYWTPIAWVRSDGEIYKVSQKFSVTTSKHQGLLYLM